MYSKKKMPPFNSNNIGSSNHISDVSENGKSTNQRYALTCEQKSEMTAKQKIAFTLIVQRLKKLKKGQLILAFAEQRFEFGEPTHQAQTSAEININNPNAFLAIVANANIGAAEAYIRGDWNTPNLLNVIQVVCLNLNVMSELQSSLFSPVRLVRSLGHLLNRNSPKGSRKNISAHYDLSNDFFGLFLDPTMMYSSAIFPNKESSLETASNAKMQRICEKLQLNETDHLLEIGTGWGSLALYAAKHYGCKVTTTTISKEQHNYATQIIKQAGLSDKVTLLLSDYRSLSGKYDKIVSVEMIEAVGHQYYTTYFNSCSRLLKSDGLMLIQSITIADQRYEKALQSVDFIQQYIFPGGCLPSNEVICKHIAKDTDMQLIELHDITPHYANTLAAWRNKFWHNIEEIKRLGFDDEFARMWDFYLVYCEGGFRERVISTGQYLIAKPDYKYT